MVVSVAHTSTPHAHIDSVLISGILRHPTHTQSTHIRGIAGCLPVSNGFHRPFAWYVLCICVRCTLRAVRMCAAISMMTKIVVVCMLWLYNSSSTTQAECAVTRRKRKKLKLRSNGRACVSDDANVCNKQTNAYKEVVVRETTKLMEFGTNIFLWCCCAVLLSLLFFSRSARSRSVSECVFICVYRSLYDDCVCDSTCSFFLNLTHSPSIRSSNSVIVELSWCKHQPD